MQPVYIATEAAGHTKHAEQGPGRAGYNLMRRLPRFADGSS